MARAIRTSAPTVFRNNEFDLRTELLSDKTENSAEDSQSGSETWSPFQRAKVGSRECFLAAEAFPIRTDVN